MKRLSCKLFILLTLMMLFVICLVPSALATFDKTANDAVNWALGHTSGQGYEYDNYTGYYDNGQWVYVGPQCVDLIVGYMNYLGGSHTRGDGKDYASNSLPSGYTRTYQGTPQKGDIIVWTTGKYGHVAIATSVASDGKVTLTEQNYVYSCAISHTRTFYPSSTTYWGIIHPDFKPETGILDVNGWLDGDSTAGNVAGYGTFDVYINGSLASNDVTDYYNSALAAGTTYEIKDIRATSGHVYQGVANGSSLSGTISAGNTIDVRLKFLSQYTISYNANGGSGAPASQTKTYGTALTLSSTRPTRTGYVFQGWATSASATSAAYQPGSSYTSNSAATLYAVWKPQTYTVTLNANGGSVSVASLNVTYDSTYGSLPTPSYSGYLFDGWYTSSTGGSKVISTTKVTSASNHTLYAHWHAIPKTKLPTKLQRIEDEAFANSDIVVAIVPSNCEYIGSKAFANCSNLICVYFPATDMIIKADAFSGCSNFMFCCYDGTSAQIYAEGKGIPYVLYSTDWVLADNAPAGATITQEKWTYTKSTTETQTSTASSISGWTQSGYTWQKTGSGTHTYANYPSGFDTGHSLYSKYAKSALSSSTSGNTKREVSSSSLVDYIYWHWAWRNYLANSYISDTPGEKDGRNFQYFYAFESATDYGHTQPDGVTDPDCFYTQDYPGGSWWWWRFEVRKQTYTDYQKLFTYTRTTTEQKESTQAVTAGGDISNVKHWVKYTY